MSFSKYVKNLHYVTLVGTAMFRPHNEIIYRDNNGLHCINKIRCKNIIANNPIRINGINEPLIDIFSHYHNRRSIFIVVSKNNSIYKVTNNEVTFVTKIDNSYLGCKQNKWRGWNEPRDWVVVTKYSLIIIKGIQTNKFSFSRCNFKSEIVLYDICWTNNTEQYIVVLSDGTIYDTQININNSCPKILVNNAHRPIKILDGSKYYISGDKRLYTIDNKLIKCNKNSNYKIIYWFDSINIHHFILKNNIDYNLCHLINEKLETINTFQLNSIYTVEGFNLKRWFKLNMFRLNSINTEEIFNLYRHYKENLHSCVAMNSYEITYMDSMHMAQVYKFPYRIVDKTSQYNIIKTVKPGKSTMTDYLYIILEDGSVYVMEQYRKPYLETRMKLIIHSKLIEIVATYVKNNIEKYEMLPSDILKFIKTEDIEEKCLLKN